MTQKDKERIIEFCKKNLYVYTDWTGTRVETTYSCESVKDFTDELINYIEQ